MYVFLMITKYIQTSKWSNALVRSISLILITMKISRFSSSQFELLFTIFLFIDILAIGLVNQNINYI